VKSQGPPALSDGRPPPTASSRPRASDQSGVSTAGFSFGRTASAAATPDSWRAARRRPRGSVVATSPFATRKASRRSEDLLLEGPCDGDALVRLSDGAAQLLREMVGVHGEGLGALGEEMIEDVKQDRAAREKKERLGRCACFGAEARAETGREDEGDHPA